MAISPDATLELVTMEVAGQQFGIPVARVRDVLGPQRVTRIPLAPAAVSGSLNLRGRIVTVLDMCVSLGLGRTIDADKAMHVVIDAGGELYSLLVDQVGDVLAVSGATVETPPPTLDTAWRSVSDGIVKLEDRLMLVLLLDRVLASVVEPARAA